jgi:hypothetical protein
VADVEGWEHSVHFKLEFCIHVPCDHALQLLRLAEASHVFESLCVHWRQMSVLLLLDGLLLSTVLGYLPQDQTLEMHLTPPLMPCTVQCLQGGAALHNSVGGYRTVRSCTDALPSAHQLSQ